MNNCNFTGRLTKDPEMMVTQSGLKVTDFTIAVKRFNPNNSKDADFIPCKAYEGKAEYISKFGKKGMKVAISGDIKTGSYKKSDGTTAYTWHANVKDIEIDLPKQETTQGVDDYDF